MIITLALIFSMFSAARFGARAFVIVVVFSVVKGFLVGSTSGDSTAGTITACANALLSTFGVYFVLRLKEKMTYVPRYSVPNPPPRRRVILWEYAPLLAIAVACGFFV